MGSPACHFGPQHVKDLAGPRFNIKMVSSFLTSIWTNPMLKERRPVGRLFFNMGLPIPVRRRLYIETGSRFLQVECCTKNQDSKMSQIDMVPILIRRRRRPGILVIWENKRQYNAVSHWMSVHID